MPRLFITVAGRAAVPALLAAGCGGADSPAAPPEEPRLVLVRESAIPPTLSPSIALVDDSTTCVIESYETRVLCGDLSWKNVRPFGRQGEGPGEFRTPMSVIAGEGARVGVFDPTLGRLSVFRTDGTPVLQQTFSEVDIPLALRADEYVWANFAPGSAAAQSYIHQTPLGAGDAVRVPLAAPPPLADGDAGGFRSGSQAFGDEIVFWTGDYQLVRYGPDGDARGVLPRPPVAPELPSDLDAELLNESIRGYLGVSVSARQTRQYRAIPKAPLNRDRPLRSDGAGRLWAITTRDHVRRSHFDVFDRDGFIGTASVPDRVLGYDIRGDLLAALVLVPAGETDGVHGYRIRWYRIEGGAGPGA